MKTALPQFRVNDEEKALLGRCRTEPLEGLKAWVCEGSQSLLKEWSQPPGLNWRSAVYEWLR